MKFVKAALPLLFSGALLAAGAAQAAQKDVTVAVASTFTTLDPYNASDTLSQAVVKSFYEGLFSFDKDMKLVNVLAESYEASPDGLVYTVKLRKGVKFQNGEDFTAEAVKINYERVMDKKNSLKRYVLFSNIDRIDVVDAHTVKFHAEEAFLRLHQPARASERRHDLPEGAREVGRSDCLPSLRHRPLRDEGLQPGRSPEG